jgi:hypothetical protein
MPGDLQHQLEEFRSELEMKLASVDDRIRQLRSELSLMRSDLIRVALVAGETASSSEG